MKKSIEEKFYKVIGSKNIFSVKQGVNPLWYVIAESKEQVLGLANKRNPDYFKLEDIEQISHCDIILGECSDYNEAVNFEDKINSL